MIAKFHTFTLHILSFMLENSYVLLHEILTALEINYKLYVRAKFRGNESRGFGFRTQKPPQKIGVKSGLIQKWLKYRKIISHVYTS